MTLRRQVLRLVAAGLACVALVSVPFVGMACQQPKQSPTTHDDGVSPRDCADRDNAEVCAP